MEAPSMRRRRVAISTIQDASPDDDDEGAGSHDGERCRALLLRLLRDVAAFARQQQLRLQNNDDAHAALWIHAVARVCEERVDRLQRAGTLDADDGENTPATPTDIVAEAMVQELLVSLLKIRLAETEAMVLDEVENVESLRLLRVGLQRDEATLRRAVRNGAGEDTQLMALQRLLREAFVEQLAQTRAQGIADALHNESSLQFAWETIQDQKQEIVRLRAENEQFKSRETPTMSVARLSDVGNARHSIQQLQLQLSSHPYTRLPLMEAQLSLLEAAMGQRDSVGRTSATTGATFSLSRDDLDLNDSLRGSVLLPSHLNMSTIETLPRECAQCRRYERAYVECHSDNKRLRAQAVADEDALVRAEQAYLNLKNEHTALTSSLLVAKQKQEELRQMIMEITDEKLKFQSIYESQQRTHEQHVVTLQRQLTEFEQSRERSARERVDALLCQEALENELGRLKASVDMLQNERKLLEEGAQELQLEVTDLKSQTAEAKANAKVSARALTTAEQEVESIKTRLDAARQQALQHESTIDDLARARQELAVSEAAASRRGVQLERERDLLADNTKRLTQEITDLKGETAAAITEVEANLKVLTTKLSEEELGNERLRVSHAALQTEHDVLLDGIQRLKQETADTKERKRLEEASTEEAHQSLLVAERELESLKQTLEATRQETSQHLARIEQLNGALNERSASEATALLLVRQLENERRELVESVQQQHQEVVGRKQELVEKASQTLETRISLASAERELARVKQALEAAQEEALQHQLAIAQVSLYTAESIGTHASLPTCTIGVQTVCSAAPTREIGTQTTQTASGGTLQQGKHHVEDPASRDMSSRSVIRDEDDNPSLHGRAAQNALSESTLNKFGDRELSQREAIRSDSAVASRPLTESSDTNGASRCSEMARFGHHCSVSDNKMRVATPHENPNDSCEADMVQDAVVGGKAEDEGRCAEHSERVLRAVSHRENQRVHSVSEGAVEASYDMEALLLEATPTTKSTVRKTGGDTRAAETSEKCATGPSAVTATVESEKALLGWAALVEKSLLRSARTRLRSVFASHQQFQARQTRIRTRLALLVTKLLSASRVHALQAMLTVANSELQWSKQHQEAAKQKQDDLRMLIVEITNEKVQIQSLHASQQHVHEEHVDDLQRQLAELERSLGRSEQERLDALARRGAVGSDLGRIETSHEELRKEKSVLVDTTSRLRQKVSDLEQEMAMEQTNAKETRDGLATAERELAMVKPLLDAARLEVAEQASRIEQLKRERSQLSESEAGASLLVRRLQDQLHRLADQNTGEQVVDGQTRLCTSIGAVSTMQRARHTREFGVQATQDALSAETASNPMFTPSQRSCQPAESGDGERANRYVHTSGLVEDGGERTVACKCMMNNTSGVLDTDDNGLGRQDTQREHAVSNPSVVAERSVSLVTESTRIAEALAGQEAAALGQARELLDERGLLGTSSPRREREKDVESAATTHRLEPVLHSGALVDNKQRLYQEMVALKAELTAATTGAKETSRALRTAESELHAVKQQLEAASYEVTRRGSMIETLNGALSELSLSKANAATQVRLLQGQLERQNVRAVGGDMGVQTSICTNAIGVQTTPTSRTHSVDVWRPGTASNRMDEYSGSGGIATHPAAVTPRNDVSERHAAGNSEIRSETCSRDAQTYRIDEESARVWQALEALDYEVTADKDPELYPHKETRELVPLRNAVTRPVAGNWEDEKTGHMETLKRPNDSVNAWRESIEPTSNAVMIPDASSAEACELASVKRSLQAAREEIALHQTTIERLNACVKERAGLSERNELELTRQPRTQDREGPERQTTVTKIKSSQETVHTGTTTNPESAVITHARHQLGAQEGSREEIVQISANATYEPASMEASLREPREEIVDHESTNEELNRALRDRSEAAASAAAHTELQQLQSERLELKEGMQHPKLEMADRKNEVAVIARTKRPLASVAAERELASGRQDLKAADLEIALCESNLERMDHERHKVAKSEMTASVQVRALQDERDLLLAKLKELQQELKKAKADAGETVDVLTVAMCASEFGDDEQGPVEEVVVPVEALAVHDEPAVHFNHDLLGPSSNGGDSCECSTPATCEVSSLKMSLQAAYREIALHQSTTERLNVALTERSPPDAAAMRQLGQPQSELVKRTQPRPQETDKVQSQTTPRQTESDPAAGADSTHHELGVQEGDRTQALPMVVCTTNPGDGPRGGTQVMELFGEPVARLTVDEDDVEASTHVARKLVWIEKDHSEATPMQVQQLDNFPGSPGTPCEMVPVITDLEAARQEIARHKTMIATLNQALHALSETTAASNRQVVELRDEREGLVERIRRLKQETADLKAEQDVAKTKSGQTRVALVAAEGELASGNQDLDAAHQELALRASTIASLNDELREGIECRTTASTQVRQLQRERDVLVEKVKDLDEDLAMTKTTADEAAKALTAAESEMVSVTQRLDAARQQIAQHESTFAKLKCALKGLSESEAAASTHVLQLERECDVLVESVQQLELKTAHLEEEVTVAKASARDSHKALVSVQSELISGKQSLEAAQQEIKRREVILERLKGTPQKDVSETWAAAAAVKDPPPQDDRARQTPQRMDQKTGGRTHIVSSSIGVERAVQSNQRAPRARTKTSQIPGPLMASSCVIRDVAGRSRAPHDVEGNDSVSDCKRVSSKASLETDNRHVDGRQWLQHEKKSSHVMPSNIMYEDRGRADNLDDVSAVSVHATPVTTVTERHVENDVTTTAPRAAVARKPVAKRRNTEHAATRPVNQPKQNEHHDRDDSQNAIPTHDQLCRVAGGRTSADDRFQKCVTYLNADNKTRITAMTIPTGDDPTGSQHPPQPERCTVLRTHFVAWASVLSRRRACGALKALGHVHTEAVSSAQLHSVVHECVTLLRRCIKDQSVRNVHRPNTRTATAPATKRSPPTDGGDWMQVVDLNRLVWVLLEASKQTEQLKTAMSNRLDEINAQEAQLLRLERHCTELRHIVGTYQAQRHHARQNLPTQAPTTEAQDASKWWLAPGHPAQSAVVDPRLCALEKERRQLNQRNVAMLERVIEQLKEAKDARQTLRDRLQLKSRSLDNAQRYCRAACVENLLLRAFYAWRLRTSR